MTRIVNFTVPTIISNIEKLAISFLLLILLTACGGGGGGSSNDSSDTNGSEPDIYLADNYINTSLDDSSLGGVWMLVEKSTLEFDLDDVSAIEGFFELDYSRRSIISIVEFPIDATDPDILAIHCLDNNIISFELATVFAGVINLQLEGFYFEGSIVNNNLIEGQLYGESEGAQMLESSISLVKIASPEQPFDTSVNISIGSEVIEDTSLGCFEQTEFSGESFIDNQLVNISGISLYASGLLDPDGDGTVFLDDGVDISILEILVDDVNVKSLETNTPTSMFFLEENAAISITNNTTSTLSASASGTDEFGVTANVDFSIVLP